MASDYQATIEMFNKKKQKYVTYEDMGLFYLEVPMGETTNIYRFLPNGKFNDVQEVQNLDSHTNGAG